VRIQWAEYDEYEPGLSKSAPTLIILYQVKLKLTLGSQPVQASVD